MGRFDDSIVNDYAGAASNPAAPAALGQIAKEAGAVQTGSGRFADSVIGQYVNDTGSFVDVSKSWYGGANMEGVSNSWDTGFMSEAFKQFDEQQQAAADAQDGTKFFDWFDRQDATGVSLWDDKARGIERGDVFNDGQKVGNVFKDFDERTANVMMAEFVLDRDTKAKIFADPDRDRWLGDEVTKQLDANTQMIGDSAAQKAFGEAVDARQEGLLEGKSEAGFVAGGAAGGAAVGAGIGALFGGVGAGPGALIGGGVGAVGGFLNRDQLSEQTARAMEVTSLANQRFSNAATAATALKEFGGVGMRFISPVSNNVQGIYDAMGGKGGDGESEFYALDENGERKAPIAARVLDVAASVADGAGQFGTRAGVGLYLGATGATVTGSIGQLAATGGKRWNDYEADFTSPDGAGQWAATVGSIGIDAVQMGFGAAVAKAGVGARAALGLEQAAAPGRVAQAYNRIAPWRSADEVSSQTINGMRFGLNEAGEAVSRRASLTLLAPSEALRYVPTAMKARVRALNASGQAASADDYYRAALESVGGKGYQAAMVNGFMESTEEAVQGVLDPVSFGQEVDGAAVVEQAAYGFAGGFGMSIGRISMPPSSDAAMRARADLTYSLRNGGSSLTDDQWNAMSRDERKLLATADSEESQLVLDNLRTMAAAQRINMHDTSVIGTMAAADMATAAFTRDTASINPNADNVLAMGGMSTDRVYATDAQGNRYLDRDLMPANAAVSSIWQTLTLLTNKAPGLRTQLEDIEQRLATLDPEATDEQVRLASEQALVTRAIEINANVRRELMDLYSRYREDTDVATREAIIDEFNLIITNANAGLDVDGTALSADDAEAARRAVELIFTRHPIIEGGSFTVLVPQASKAMSRANAHGQVLTHQSVIKAMGADRDGDTTVTQGFQLVPQAQLDEIRAGVVQYLAPVRDEIAVGTDAQGNPITEVRDTVEVYMDAPDGEKRFIADISTALAQPTSVLHNAATSELQGLVSDLRARYVDYFDADVLDRLLSGFERDVVAGVADARIRLATALVRENRGALLQAGIDNKMAELPWMMQRISLSWGRFQQTQAAENPGLDFTEKDVNADLPAEKAYARANAIREMATAGQTAQLLAEGDTSVRVAQKFHYSVYRALVDAQTNPGFLPEGFDQAIRDYAQMGSDMGRSKRAEIFGRNAIQRRVVSWLEDIVSQAGDTFGADAKTATLLLASTQVRDIRILGNNQYEMADGDISLVQLLLKRSIEIEQIENRSTIESDEELQRKIRRLSRLAERNVDDKERSVTSQLAMLEVFADVPVYNLLGDSAQYLGAQLTPAQLLAQLTNVDDDTRSDMIYRWRRKAPYVLHAPVGNPPYTVAETASQELSPYRVLVDALAAGTRTAPRERRARDARVAEQFRAGITQLQSMVASYRRTERMDDADFRTTLERMLSRNTGFATTLANLLPEAARRGIIKVENGRGFVSNWVYDMLEQDPAKAAVTYRVNTWIAEWNALGARSDLDTQADTELGGRQYSKIQSRMLQTFYHLAAQPTDFEMNRLLLVMQNAPSIEALMDAINAEPAWVGGRAELLAFFDDVADFEVDPSQVWSANLPGSLTRDAIDAFAARSLMLSETMVSQEQQLRTERMLLAGIRTYLETQGTDSERVVDEGRKYHDLLDLTIKNRQLYPDHVGAAVRDRFTRAIQEGVLRFHDKGKADRNVAPMGEFLVTADEFGVKQSVFQTADGLTIYDADDILTNPTKLVEGPVRVAGLDGQIVTVDLTTVEGALSALENPATNAFAKMVLFPTARELNAADVVSPRQDTRTNGLKSMLDEAKYYDVFPKTDERPTLAQAHKYISTLEAAIRRSSIGKSEAERAEAYFPIQNAINEFVIAYTHRIGARKYEADDLRAGLFIDMAQALQALGALNSANPTLVDDVADILKASLKARFARDAAPLRKILAGELETATEDAAVLDAYANVYTRRMLNAQQELATAAEQGDKARVTALTAEIEQIQAELQERIDALELLADDDVVNRVVNMFQVTGDPHGDIARKTAILEFLGSSARKDRFQGPYALMERLNTVLAEDGYALTDPDAFSDAQWKELGTWATSIYLAERVGRAGSNVDLTPVLLGPEGRNHQRYFDFTWSYLVDGLVSRTVLDAASRLGQQADWVPDTTPADVAGILERGLFDYRKLGEWTEVVVSKSLQARQALSQAPVGLAIPVGGELPKEAAAYVGAGRWTYRRPTEDMLTTEQVSIDPSQGDAGWTMVQRFKLNNHFARSVRVTATLADGSPLELDLTTKVGAQWMGEDSVRDSGYHLITIDRIDRALAEVLESNDLAGNLELTIDYFDVDTMPYAEEWKNNVYFVGSSREGETPLTPSPIAGLVFGVGALSKQAQQEPLNMATKGGEGYKPTPVTMLSTAVALEGSNRPADVLLAKTLHMAAKEYDFGLLLDSDLPALYELMKMRHVVVGTNASGEKEVWWSHRAIADGRALNDPEFPLTDARLVPLSEAQAQSLLGEPGTKGLRGAVVEPVLNLDDMPVLPEITAERLAELDLTMLGDEGTLDDTSLAGLTALPLTSKVNDSGRIGASPFEAKIQKLQERQLKTSYARQQVRGTEGFKPDAISTESARKLKRMLDEEALAPLFARLGIPFTSMHDMTEVALSTQLSAKLLELAQVDGNAVIWQHVQDAAADASAGVFTQVSLKNDFESVPSHGRPVLGDTVVIDLDSFVRKAGGNTVVALDQAKEAVQAYARTGARIVLGGSTSSDLRSELGDYLRSGRDGYSQMAESAHFFAPTYQDTAVSQNRQAIDSTLTATRVFTGNSLILTHEADFYADGATENSSYFDLRPGQPVWRGQALTLLPTRFDRYGIPVQGNGALNQMAAVRARVTALLESQAGRDFLRRHGGDPDGTPLYSNVNGVESPGIRSIDDAMDRLLDVMNSGSYPVEEGQEIMTGDLIPVLGTDGSILFVRVGFQIPSATEISTMIKAPLDPENPVVTASNFAIAPAKLQETWTTRPPGIIEKVNVDPMAGSSVQVKYDLARFGKGIAEGDGWKTMYAPMPNDLAGPAEDLGSNGLRFNAFTGRKSRESKQAVEGQITSFDWAFALSGVDFRREMVDYFMGAKKRTPEQQSSDWAIVKTYLDRVSRMDHGFTASELSDFFNTGRFRGAFRTSLTTISEEVFGQGYTLPAFENGTTQTPTERLGEVMLMSLMAPRVRLSDVISTSGIATLERLDGNSKVTLMPKIFTDALEDYSHPELRRYLMDKVNAQLPRRADGSRPYFLKDDWRFYIEMQNPQTGQPQWVPGTAHISLEFAADENPVNYVQSSIRSARQGASQHVSFVTNEAINARTTVERALRQTTELFSDAGLERFDSEQGDGGFYQLMNAIPASDQSYKPWRRSTPAQRLYKQEAQARRVAYLRPIDQSDWTDSEKAAYATLQNDIVSKVFGQRGESYRTDVDYWVRQMFGIAAAREGQDPNVGKVSAEVAKQAAQLILDNVRKNLIPTYGGVVALWDHDIAAAVFEENQGRGADAWAPKLGTGRKAALAKEWSDWATATVGQVRESDAVFITAFRYDLDGFWHTWLNATPEMTTLPVSMDEVVDKKLMDRDSNLALASLDPNQEALLTNPVVFDTMRGTLNALVGQDQQYRADAARTAPASELNQRIERIMAWQNSKRIPKSEGRLSYRKYMEEGSHYIQSSRDTHTFFHNMVNLSVGMRLLNPALWTSAVIEVFVRNKMETLTNIATGRSTSVVGKGLARVGVQPVYTAEQLDRLNKLADTMGQDNRFLSMVYDELTYKNLVDPSHGRIGNALEKFAKFSATATSDPHFGMKAKNLAKRYLEAAMEYLDDTNSAVPFDVFVSAMNRDPRWLHDQVEAADPSDPRRIGFNAHRAGMNRIAQVRSMRQTVAGKAIMSPIDMLTQHHSWGAQATGHLLKIPFLFTRFNVNAFMALSGMTGVDQMAAMMLQGRENKIIGRAKAAMSGQEYSRELDRIDMSDVLEGVDLFRPFIRGGITHTGLMAFGLMAGSLNFSGEDEETKRRRRLAHWLDTPYMYDPRRLENDVTMADAIFLDAMPDWMQMMFQVSQDGTGETRSAIMPHWIVRQFMSPIVGIERFLSTGDVRQIGWGYGDAFAAIPTSVSRIKQEADITADMLLAEAAKQEGLATPESQGNITQLLVNTVGIYERALLENSFVNSLRSGADAYNRNPWVKPEVDKFGNIVRDPQTGAPIPSGQLQATVDEEGNVVAEYDQRDAGGMGGAILHQYAENNGTAAVLLSLFTGQWSTDSTYFRKNMVPKQETMYVPESSQAEAEATIMAALEGATRRGEGLENLSMYEIESTLKQEAQAKGAWWQQAEITAQAKAIYDRVNATGGGGFSLIDEKSGALLQDGASAIMDGLRSGAVKPGDESLIGVSISVPMRKKIQEEWTEELVQDGIDMGLPESVAVSRARRIWYGNTYEDPNATGLKAILWDDKIPWSTKATYNQLNVTFVLGPNGRPIATPFKRNDLLQSLGIPLPSTAWTSTPGMTKDMRGNAVDEVLGINLGLKGLERVDSQLALPVPDDDPEAFKETGRAASDGFSDGGGGSGGSGWVNFGKRGYTPYRRRSYSRSGGYSSGGGYPNFSKMYALADTQTPYGNDIPFINTSNPILRRANVRRERVWSERGRLNQWQ